MIAALYVERGGVYCGLPYVDAWDSERDARTYDGPYPVVAHPPCARWCRLAGLVESRRGLKRGEDGGCFAAALAAVRRFGGVLEHPAWTLAWPAFGISRPASFGWQLCADGSFVARVNQSAYGHLADKPTWLYAYGVVPNPISTRCPKTHMVVATSKNINHKEVIPKRMRSRSPIAFRDFLISIAESAS